MRVKHLSRSKKWAKLGIMSIIIYTRLICKSTVIYLYDIHSLSICLSVCLSIYDLWLILVWLSSWLICIFLIKIALLVVVDRLIVIWDPEMTSIITSTMAWLLVDFHLMIPTSFCIPFNGDTTIIKVSIFNF